MGVRLGLLSLLIKLGLMGSNSSVGFYQGARAAGDEAIGRKIEADKLISSGALFFFLIFISNGFQHLY